MNEFMLIKCDTITGTWEERREHIRNRMIECDNASEALAFAVDNMLKCLKTCTESTAMDDMKRTIDRLRKEYIEIRVERRACFDEIQILNMMING